MANRVVLGQLGDGSMRLRVSRPGYDAYDLNTPQQGMAFDSSWAYAASVHQSGSANVSGGVQIQWPTLPYRPLVLMQWNNAFEDPINWQLTCFDTRAQILPYGINIIMGGGFLHYVCLRQRA